MTALDWLWILHPALAVVVVYPLLGVVMRLAWQTRQRRVAKQKHPPTVGRDHSDVGRWLAASVVWLVLIALAVSIATKVPLADFAGGVTRAAQLLVVLLGTSASLIALWRCQAAVFRFSFGLLTFIGVQTLGAQPEAWCVSDDLFSSEFWQFHDWYSRSVGDHLGLAKISGVWVRFRSQELFAERDGRPSTKQPCSKLQCFAYRPIWCSRLSIKVITAGSLACCAKTTRCSV